MLTKQVYDDEMEKYVEDKVDVNKLTLREVVKNKAILKREIIAGITGFFAISYIIIVNPMILADAGIPANLSVFATILSSMIGCWIIGFWANSPIILTPGMGVNAFFTYTLVINMGLSWQAAIAVSLVSSALYIVVAFTKLSDTLSNAIPDTLINGITVGIGMFLVVIGLEKASLITAGESSFIELGSLTNPSVLLALFGLVLNLFLYLKRVNGGFLIGIITTSIVGVLFHIQDANTTKVLLSDIANYGQIVAKGDFSSLLTIPFLLAMFSMSMILIFESMGLLEGLLPDQNKFKKTFAGGSVATFLSGLFGTSPTVAAAESAAGIKSGGSTGIMAIVAGLLFGLSILFIPLLSYVPQAAIAPIIIITGAMMMQSLKFINFDSFSDWFPAFLIIVLIPFTSSISIGLSFGFVAYPLMKVFEGKGKIVHPAMYLIGLLFLLNLIFMGFM